MKPRFTLNIKRKMLLIILAVTVIPTALMNLFMFTQIRNQISDYFTTSTGDRIKQLDTTLNLFFSNISQEVQWLANNGTLQKADNSITSYETNPQSIDMTPSKNGGIEEQIYSIFKEFATAHPNTAFAYLATPDGGYVQYPEGPTGAHYTPSNRPYYIAAMKNPNEVVHTGVYYDSTDRRSIVSTVTVVRNSAHRIVGVVGLDVGLDQLTKITNAMHVDKSGFVVLAERNGTIVADSNNPTVEGKSLGHLGLKGIDNLRQIKAGGMSVSYHNQSYFLLQYNSGNPDFRYLVLIKNSELNAPIEKFGAVVLALGIIFVGLAVALAYFSANRLSRPLTVLQQSAANIASGDLTANWEVQSRDEVGLLSESLYSMSGALRGIVLHIQETVDRINHAATELSETTTENNQVSLEISSAATDLAEGAERQSSDIAATLETIEQIAAAVEMISYSVAEVAASANETKSRAEEGSQSMANVTQQMTRIEMSARDVYRIIEQLNERHRAIEGIVELIRNIASQTNLLALNAAIESARAGEHGRGFAVVAGEVRKLAGESDQATNKIATLLSEIQEQSEMALQAMTQAVEVVTQGSLMISQGHESFTEIEHSVSDLTEQIGEVDRAGKDLMEGCQSMVSQVNKVEQVTERVAGAGQQMAASTQEQSASLQTTATLVDSLSELAKELKKKIAVFKL